MYISFISANPKYQPQTISIPFVITLRFDIFDFYDLTVIKTTLGVFINIIIASLCFLSKSHFIYFSIMLSSAL